MNIISEEMFLNEIKLWAQVRTGIQLIDKQSRENFNLDVVEPFNEYVMPKIKILGSYGANEGFNVQKFKAILQSCKATPITCDGLAEDALELIKYLIKENLLDPKYFEFGGSQNLYRTPQITGISLYNLFVSKNNVLNENVTTKFAHISNNPELLNWLRTLKFLSEKGISPE